jgi:hypothetical protein
MSYEFLEDLVASIMCLYVDGLVYIYRLVASIMCLDVDGLVYIYRLRISTHMFSPNFYYTRCLQGHSGSYPPRIRATPFRICPKGN